jgi:2-isopropylmalate synthase
VVRLGADVIEAGFPASSPEISNPSGLLPERSRALSSAVFPDPWLKTLTFARRLYARQSGPEFTPGLRISDSYGKKLRLSPEQVIERAVKAVKHAKRYMHDVEFYAEDAFRSDKQFLVRI